MRLRRALLNRALPDGASRARRRGRNPASERSTLLGVAAAGVEVGSRRVRVADEWVATLAVVGYPAQVGPGWLEPLTAWPGRVDVTVHIEPIPTAVAAARLRRQLTRLESTRRTTTDRGRLADPGVDAATADAEDMAAGLARGDGRLFQVGLYLTVHADTEDQLDAEVAAARAVAASLLLDCVPTSWRALQGWITTLPVGVDLLRMGRTLDTAALAAGFPFSSPDLPARDPATPGAAPAGVLYGVNSATGGLVLWDRWAADNHNTLILAASGAGKSYLAKLDLLRNLHTGVTAQVVDPEDEYGRLADAVGGTVIRLGAPGIRINPLDLRGDRRADALTRRALFVHTLVGVLLGDAVDPASRAALDRAITAAYTDAGITSDRRTWRRPPPLLADVATALTADPDPAGPRLAGHLAPYTTGSWAGLFAGPTTSPTGTSPTGHLVVWSLRDLPDELRPAGTLLALDRIWTHIVSGPRRRRIVVVDEAWTLMQSEHGARFLYRMAKAARKHWAGLTVVTQDPADLLGTSLGRAVAANSATQILLRHAPQAAGPVAAAFSLTAGERDWLLTAPRGHGLLLGGRTGDRVVFEALSSAEEHHLITTDPAELADENPPEHAELVDAAADDQALWATDESSDESSDDSSWESGGEPAEV
jgi:type IV secretory pathway VirB4 component